jgi:uncharacterized membrane protein YphA (DoxX/SURF4 family)
MKIAVLITRILLGLIYAVFSFNFFLHFMPNAPLPGGKAGAFLTGLMGSGYFFQYMKFLEVACGLLLIINRFTALAVLVLFPITLNIFLYHSFFSPNQALMAIIMILINIFLIYAYRKYYMNIITMKPTL